LLVSLRAQFSRQQFKFVEFLHQVVSADFLADIKTEGVISQIKTKTISEWGSDVKERIAPIMEKARQNTKSGGE
jgi:hypothetical protein